MFAISKFTKCFVVLINSEILTRKSVDAMKRSSILVSLSDVKLHSNSLLSPRAEITKFFLCLGQLLQRNLVLGQMLVSCHL